MPTPFTHLAAAPELAQSAFLPPAALACWRAEWSAYLLGHIAPDVQTLSGQAREETHFFRVPLASPRPGAEVMLERYAELNHPAALPAARAAFLSGYLAHLVFDQLWITDIFAPVFGPDARWATFRERLYFHNALRAYVDAVDLARLEAGVGLALSRALPHQWLPFVTDGYLAQWRDAVAHQLLPGGLPRTAAVFAERMGTEVHAFTALVSSEDAMQQHVFSHLPLAQLEQYRARALAEAARVLREYWAV